MARESNLSQSHSHIYHESPRNDHIRAEPAGISGRNTRVHTRARTVAIPDTARRSPAVRLGLPPPRQLPEIWGSVHKSRYRHHYANTPTTFPSYAMGIPNTGTCAEDSTVVSSFAIL